MTTNITTETTCTETNDRSDQPQTSNIEEGMEIRQKALAAKVSVFESAMNPVPVEELKTSVALTRIFNNEDMRKRIEHARKLLKENDSDAYSAYKKTLPAVTFSGVFSKRNNASITEPSGLIVLDFDHTDEQTESLMEAMKSDEYVIAAFRSPSGYGVKVLLYADAIRNDDDHKVFFSAAENYILQKYGLKIDKACKDIARLTFLSYDPDIYVSKKPKEFEILKWLPRDEPSKESNDSEPAKKAPSKPTTQHEYSGKALYAWKIVESACERIRNSLPGNQHDTRLKESRLVGGYLHYGLDEEHVYEALESAVEDSGAKDIKSALKTILDGIKYGIDHPAEIPDLERMTVMTVDDGSKNATVIRKPSNTNGHVGYDGYDGSFESKIVKAIPPAPLGVFHPALRFCMQEIGTAKQVPIEICIAAMLAYLATLVGRSCGLKIKDNWTEHGNLYIALVARSGVGKTPATNYIFKPITNLERMYYHQYEEELRRYQIEYEDWDSTKKDKKLQRDQSICKPDHPIRKEIIADDFTIEALTNSLIYNPKGIAIIKDEISGLFYNLDKYSQKQGGTITRLIEAYDSRDWKTNRVNSSRNSYVSDATLSIFGTIQPGILKNIFKQTEIESGFTSRFAFINAYPNGPSLWSDKCESKEVNDILEHIGDKISLLQPDPNPTEIQCTEEAKNAFIEFNNEISTQSWMGSADNEDSVLQKMKARCLRICLLMHISTQILENKDITTNVSLETMNNAITLTHWLIQHTKITWSMLKDNSTLATGKELMVAQAIINLESSVRNNFLSTQAITEEVNRNQKPEHHLSPLAVGKIRKSLNINEGRNPSQRGWEITPAVIAHCRSLVEKTVITDITVTTQENQGNTYDGWDISTVINRHNRQPVPKEDAWAM